MWLVILPILSELPRTAALFLQANVQLAASRTGTEMRLPKKSLLAIGKIRLWLADALVFSLISALVLRNSGMRHLMGMPQEVPTRDGYRVAHRLSGMIVHTTTFMVS